MMEFPCGSYLYHTLYSLDRWYINPGDATYLSPQFHTETLADLNIIPTEEYLERNLLESYFYQIKDKILKYIDKLDDNELTQKPADCDISRFRLILGQFRHWHRHMGIIYGFIVVDEGEWPYVLNMDGKYPEEPMPNFY